MEPRWSLSRVAMWYSKSYPIRGVNYLPRTAVNATEMWQRESFDIPTIAQELKWARRLGFNSLRIFLPFIVWEEDAAGMKSRLDNFLDVAADLGFRSVPVFFDDCAFSGAEPRLGKQPDPVPGIHNSRWTPSPGTRFSEVESGPQTALRAFVQETIASLMSDSRILMWDLYNEPGNGGRDGQTQWLVDRAFDWAREVNPSQPLTSGIWRDFDSINSRKLLDLSDVLSFHFYEDLEDGTWQFLRALLTTCERPAVCTEMLNRLANNTFERFLPILDTGRMGWFSWGLVAGRTQTYLPWNFQPGDEASRFWQHDLLYADGSVYDAAEARLLSSALT